MYQATIKARAPRDYNPFDDTPKVKYFWTLDPHDPIRYFDTPEEVFEFFCDEPINLLNGDDGFVDEVSFDDTPHMAPEGFALPLPKGASPKTCASCHGLGFVTVSNGVGGTWDQYCDDCAMGAELQAIEEGDDWGALARSEYDRFCRLEAA